MNIKESIKKDWRVDVGIVFFIIFISSIGFSFTYKNPLIFFIIYLFLVVVSLFLNVADEAISAFLFPILPVLFLGAIDHDKRIKKYLKDIIQNTHKSAVVILAHYDIYHFKYAMKPNYDIGNIKSMVGYLKNKRKNDFSFYLNASREDVESIMLDENVREVFFVGHGDSHVFVLSLDDEIYYCDFKEDKYKKDYIHQVHCGDKSSKNLINYIVPEENKKDCFFFNKTIRPRHIDKWFKKFSIKP